MNSLAAIIPQESSRPVEAAVWTSDRQTTDRDTKAPTPESSPPSVSRKTAEEVTEAMGAYMASLGVELSFHIDENTDRLQVEVRDPKTDKLIRKIPPDDLLRLAAAIEETVGVLIDRPL